MVNVVLFVLVIMSFMRVFFITLSDLKHYSNVYSQLANQELEEALYSLITSIALLLFVLLLGPLIFFFNRNIALMGEVRIT